jgi:hypothetical protein
MHYFRQNDFPFLEKNTLPGTGGRGGEGDDMFWIGTYNDAPFCKTYDLFFR